MIQPKKTTPLDVTSITLMILIAAICIYVISFKVWSKRAAPGAASHEESAKVSSITPQELGWMTVTQAPQPIKGSIRFSLVEFKVADRNRGIPAVVELTSTPFAPRAEGMTEAFIISVPGRSIATGEPTVTYLVKEFRRKPDKNN